MRSEASAEVTVLIFHFCTFWRSNRIDESQRKMKDHLVPVQSGGCPVHVPFVVQCLVVRPDVLKPSQHA